MRKLLLFALLVALLFVLAPLAAAPVAQAQADPLPVGAAHWWDGRVFYEIFVRSFYDSDGDGIGDFRGVLQKLDYLNDGDPATTDDLGITGIWLMPINPSPSYHGYDVTDYRDVNPQYGTLDDFRELLAEADRRGIAVIMDLVLNHTSVQHPWFIASAQGDPAYADWYVWRDTDPNTPGPWGQDVWHARGGRFYYGVFWDGMPDLNYANPAVTAEMYDVARFWLEDVGVDGFRLDAIMYVVEEGNQLRNAPGTVAWMEGFNAHVKRINPDALLVGEVWTSSRIVSRYVPAAVDIAFEFDLALGLLDSARDGSTAPLTFPLRQTGELYPPGQFAPFLTNHDQSRVMTELLGDVGKARAAAALLLTMPGVPFLYYGEEIGLGGQRPPDEQVRTPMQWDGTDTAGFTRGRRPWQPFSRNPLQPADANVAAQAAHPDSLLSWYRQLIHLRSGSPALRYGTLIPVDTGGNAGLYAAVRQTAEQTVLVLVNLTGEPLSNYALTLDTDIGLSGSAALALFGAADPLRAPSWSGGSFAAYRPVTSIPAFGMVVIELR